MTYSSLLLVLAYAYGLGFWASVRYSLRTIGGFRGLAYARPAGIAVIALGCTVWPVSLLVAAWASLARHLLAVAR